MLLFVTFSSQKMGFFGRRKAKKGKLPPAITGVTVGKYPAVRLELMSRDPQKIRRWLAPYRERGDVLIGKTGQEEWLSEQGEYMTDYARRLCVNEAIGYLQSKKKAQATLIDRQGECVGVAAELLAVCNTVYVATRQEEWFTPCAAYTRLTYGNEPIFAQQTALPLTDVVVAPYGLQGWIVQGGRLYGQPGRFPKKEQWYLPCYAHLPQWDPAVVTAGVFAAFHPQELMTALPCAEERNRKEF